MNRLSFLLCAILTVNCFGCGLVNGTKKLTKQSAQLISGNPYDAVEEFDDPNRVDANQEQMMLDARHGLGASNEPDKWWSDWLQSAESRSIERSLGVEYY
jgi:hypothetical protein